MTYEFGYNPKTTRRALPIARKLIADGDMLLAQGLELPVENREIVRALAGWWRHVNVLAEDFINRVEAGRTITTTPIYRSIVEHVYKMLWLASEGANGLAVLDFSTWNNKKILLEELTDPNTGKRRWPALDHIEIGAPPGVDLSHASADPEIARLKVLLTEFKRFNKLTARFGEEDMYTVYRHLCDYTHASAYTADAYTEDLGDGMWAIRTDAKPSDGERADVIWLPILLMQAGLVLSSRLKGDPFRKQIKRAAFEYDVPVTRLLPVALPATD
ncbi:DUF5677 domain-containing protein [Streptosporangium sp. CA-115845]|uniref:DUF5677 domain-containing protein n=1 Tax=Streptosporangium sp. CA-115845 TaxID=3240071 RepID=UPI003D90899D